MRGFGTCCNDLREVLNGDFERLFFTGDNGVLYNSVGYKTFEGGGVGWFDMAVQYCPYCGTKLQDKAAIAKASR